VPNGISPLIAANVRSIGSGASESVQYWKLSACLSNASMVSRSGARAKWTKNVAVADVLLTQLPYQSGVMGSADAGAASARPTESAPRYLANRWMNEFFMMPPKKFEVEVRTRAMAVQSHYWDGGAGSLPI
jgi:hypothetical protein